MGKPGCDGNGGSPQDKGWCPWSPFPSTELGLTQGCFPQSHVATEGWGKAMALTLAEAEWPGVSQRLWEQESSSCRGQPARPTAFFLKCPQDCNLFSACLSRTGPTAWGQGPAVFFPKTTGPGGPAEPPPCHDLKVRPNVFLAISSPLPTYRGSQKSPTA